MTDYVSLLDRSARQLNHIIKNDSDYTLHEIPGYSWETFKYTSSKFRLAIVEILKKDQFINIHCCVLPNITDPSPIFGFDITGTSHKVTTAFLDLSPTITDPGHFHSIKIQHKIEAQNWGDVYSNSAIICKPDKTELIDIIGESQRLLKSYLNVLNINCIESSQILERQNQYCAKQQQNVYLRKLHKNIAGAEKTEIYINEILFPVI